MFTRQRLSRAPEPPINSGAIAAASAIGKALKENGRTVDQSKLPQYSSVPKEMKRSSSVVGSRRNSLQPRASMGSSRNSSLTSVGSSNSNISDKGRRKSQIRAPNTNFNRCYSLQSQRKPPSRNNSVTSRTTEHSSDPQHTFHEFGGPQASGVLYRNSSTAEKPKTIRKYIPSAHGLVGVDVPVEEHLLQQKRASSLRRSTSTNGLSVSRNGSLSKRNSSDTSSNSQHRRHSSLTNTSNQQSIESSPDYSGRARKLTAKPLIQTFLQEETEQELKQDDAVLRPLLISRDADHPEAEEQADKTEIDVRVEKQRLEEANLLAKAAELQEKIKKEELKVKEETEIIKEKARKLQIEQELALNHITTSSSSEKGLKNRSDVDQDSENEEMKAEEPISKVDHVNPEDEQNIKPQIKIQEETDVIIGVSDGKDTQADLTNEVLAEINNIGAKEETSEDEFVDSQDGIDNFKEDDIEFVSNSSPTRRTANGPSLAQHLRAANPYLKQASDAENRANEENESSNPTSSLEVNKNGTKALYKVPSPMKSALKKTHTHSSNTSSIYSEKSPANQAYLSLTTAENTRLNAQLASTENPPLKSNTKLLSRPQSMVNPKANRSSSPTPRESTRSKRVSTGSQQKPANRSTFYKTSNDSTPDAATAAAKTSASASRMKNSNASANRMSQVKGVQKKDSAADSQASNTPPTNILYPKEPPQKKSSFEKLRNQDTHLGFKKLSLRDEYITDAAYEQSNLNNKFRQNVPAPPNRQNSGGPSNGVNEASQNFLQNSGWKSRIHDSDSEDESAPFSSAGTSRSTQPTSSGTNTDKSNGTGFSFFKHKGKSHNASNLAPPQPQYLETEVVEQKVEKAGSANATPTKINKKWSKLSLRSSSTGEAYDAKHQGAAKTASPEKRFHSNSKVEGFSYENMKPRTLRGDIVDKGEVDTPVKKKNAFGKKLKKLFGRNT